jgi:hypothetical protein
MNILYNFTNNEKIPTLYIIYIDDLIN